MTLWEFTCCVEGFRMAHTSDDKKDVPHLTDEELKNYDIVGFN